MTLNAAEFFGTIRSGYKTFPTGRCRTQRSEELRQFYSNSMMIRPMGMKWVAHVACAVTKSKAYRVLVREPEEKRQPKDLHVNGRLLKWLLRKQY